MRVSKNQRSLLIEKFEAFLSSERGLSQKTLRNYRSDLNNFLNWCRYFSPESPIPFLTSSLVTFYKSAQVENRVPVATINRRLSTLRNFAEFLIFEGLLDRNPLETISNVRGLMPTKLYEPTPVVAPPQPQPAPTPVKSKPPPPRMPKELTTPYKVKGDDSLFLHRAKITTAAVSGFGSVFVLFFIAKAIFGDALLFGPLRQNASEASPQARNLNQKPIEETPLLAATVSFGDLLAQTPAVLGTSTQKISEQGTATLSAGSREIALYSPNLANNSRITVIPANSIEGVLLVSRNAPGSYFTVAVDRPIPSDIPFEWWIVEP